MISNFKDKLQEIKDTNEIKKILVKLIKEYKAKDDTMCLTIISQAINTETIDEMDVLYNLVDKDNTEAIKLIDKLKLLLFK